MSFWRRWTRHPQSTTLRKALFQVHLWTGIALGVYVLLMSVSGTLLVYRIDLARRFSRESPIAIGPNHLTVDELKAAAQRAYPQYQVQSVSPRRNPNLAVEILLQSGQKKIERLFNPFTGADVGQAVTPGFRFVQWLVSFHDDLLDPPVGREVNGVGAMLTTLLCLSGALIWWPGSGKWRPRLTVDFKANRNKLNWALHNALGFWSIGFVLMWGISGIYLCFPEPFNALSDFLDPVGGASRQPRVSDRILFWLAQAHFGRFGGLPIKLVWTLFGILPIVLMVTGFLMWWHRVLRPTLRRDFAVRSGGSGIKGAEPEAGD